MVKNKLIDLVSMIVIIIGSVFYNIGDWQYNISWMVSGVWMIRELHLIIKNK